MADKTRIAGNLVSDGNLFVNVTTDYIGIGTTNPTSKLSVVGNVNITGVVTASGFSGNATSASYATSSGIATSSGVSTSVIGGIGSITSLSVSGVTTTGTLNVGVGGTIITTVAIGNTTFVGIGSTQPTALLDINAPSGYNGNSLSLPLIGFSTIGQINIGRFGNDSSGVNGYFFNQGPAANQRHGMSTRYAGASNGIAFWALNTSYAGISNNGFFVNQSLGFTAGATIATDPDSFLVRDSINVIAQRSVLTSTAAQTFRIYNTYTSATNFERANLGWTNNTFIVGTEKGTAGGAATRLELQTDGVTRVAITTDGLIDGSALESYELDDISSGTDGQENTFIPTFNYNRVTISNPFRLMITVNGIPQSAFINNTDYVYQSNFLGSNNGFTIDTDNNIKFTESIPTGSDIVLRVLPVSNTATRFKLYPFKPTDILLGY